MPVIKNIAKAIAARRTTKRVTWDDVLARFGLDRLTRLQAKTDRAFKRVVRSYRELEKVQQKEERAKKRALSKLKF